MLRIALSILLAALACAQNNPFNKPPADVDAALRARITEFYDYHVKGQFRKADALVAEDTKDYFFESRKPQYISFDISRIDYFDNFTRAKAVIMCEMYIMMPGFNDKPVKMPTPSEWVLVDGKWFWHVDTEALRDTPFGHMTPGPPAKAGQTGPVLPTNPAALNVTVDLLLKQVKVNKEEIEIWPGDSTEVTVANTAPGTLNLLLPSMPDGVEAVLEKTSLNANESTTLKIKTTKDVRPGTLELRVEQTGQLIPIQIKLKRLQ